jgi:hypothetical protein
MSDPIAGVRDGEPAAKSQPARSSRRYGRRALLLGAAATGAGVAASLATGDAAEAKNLGDPPPVLLGSVNSATSSTEVDTTSGTGLVGTTTDNGQSGVAGIDTSNGSAGHGTYGRSTNGTGVFGQSVHGNGIVGMGSTNRASAVAGIDSSSASGNGVYGKSFNGVGVFANSPHGTALHVDGKATFSTSGSATVKGGDKTVTVKLASVTSSSLVLATIQQPESGIYLEGAVPGKGSFKITLSGKVTADVPVAWFVIG